MDGDNKYDAEAHGYQDAKRRFFLSKLPPVLQLQLCRFTYDLQMGCPTKVRPRMALYIAWLACAGRGDLQRVRACALCSKLWHI
jgi:hypothetical protein